MSAFAVMAALQLVLRALPRILMQQNCRSAGRARVNFVHLADFIHLQEEGGTVKARRQFLVACKVARLNRAIANGERTRGRGQKCCSMLINIFSIEWNLLRPEMFVLVCKLRCTSAQLRLHFEWGV